MTAAPADLPMPAPTAPVSARGPEPSLSGVLAGRTVLQLVPDLTGASGAERDVVDVAAALVQAGARALVAGPHGPLVGELQARGAEWLPLPTDSPQIGRTLANVRRLRRLIRAERVGIVHARSRAPAWSAFLATRLIGVPLVTSHSGPYAGRSLLARLYNGIMAQGDSVLVSSRFGRDQVIRRHPRAAERITVVPRGIDLAAFDPEAVPLYHVDRQREDWDATAEERVILLPGRLVPWKGQAVLIEAVKRLIARGAGPLRLVLAGEAKAGSDYLKRLARRIESDDLGDHVAVAEAPRDMAVALMAADIVVLPSTEPEAFARAVLEAMALGRPLIVADHGAQAEPVRHHGTERTGWLVPPGDVGALADALGEALALDEEARAGLARRARHLVARHFSRQQEVMATIDAYARLVSGTVPAPALVPAWRS